MSKVEIYIIVEGQSGRSLTAIQKADILEAAARAEIVKDFADYDAESRFIPYIEMHEFEALLFSDAEILAEKTEADLAQIREILERSNNNPEEIDDDPEKAPSKRLESLKSGYRKAADGKKISGAVGIQTIRRQCSHFNGWLTKLEFKEGLWNFPIIRN